MNNMATVKTDAAPALTPRAGTESELGPLPPPFRIIVQTPERARRAYRLTQFFMRLKDEKERAHFAQNPAAYIQDANLTPYERVMLLSRDYAALHEYGVPMVAVGKMLSVLGIGMPELTRAVRANSPGLDQ